MTRRFAPWALPLLAVPLTQCCTQQVSAVMFSRMEMLLRHSLRNRSYGKVSHPHLNMSAGHAHGAHSLNLKTVRQHVCEQSAPAQKECVDGRYLSQEERTSVELELLRPVSLEPAHVAKQWTALLYRAESQATVVCPGWTGCTHRCATMCSSPVSNVETLVRGGSRKILHPDTYKIYMSQRYITVDSTEGTRSTGDKRHLQSVEPG
jgi:hypothetical protein